MQDANESKSYCDLLWHLLILRQMPHRLGTIWNVQITLRWQGCWSGYITYRTVLISDLCVENLWTHCAIRISHTKAILSQPWKNNDLSVSGNERLEKIDPITAENFAFVVEVNQLSSWWFWYDMGIIEQEEWFFQQKKSGSMVSR